MNPEVLTPDFTDKVAGPALDEPQVAAGQEGRPRPVALSVLFVQQWACRAWAWNYSPETVLDVEWLFTHSFTLTPLFFFKLQEPWKELEKYLPKQSQ